MSSGRNPEQTIDARWDHAMDGLRVRVVGSRFAGLFGEVTGFTRTGGGALYVVLDGDEEAVALLWSEVRPA